MRETNKFHFFIFSKLFFILFTLPLREMAIGFATWVSVLLGTRTTSCHVTGRAWSADDRAPLAGIGKKDVRFGKTAAAKFRSTSTPRVCSWAWVRVDLRRSRSSKRAGFVVDSTRAWPPHRIAGVEGVRLACRLQVEWRKHRLGLYSKLRWKTSFRFAFGSNSKYEAVTPDHEIANSVSPDRAHVQFDPCAKRLSECNHVPAV